VTRSALVPTSTLVCTGCGAAPKADDPFPFRCPNSGIGDVDHVLERILDDDRVHFPSDGPAEANPFLRYRGLLHSYHRARAGGISDQQFVDLVARLDSSIADLDGHGFRETPFERSASLSDALGFVGPGGVWVKDETSNVAGSHKARHLMGVLLHLEVAELLGLAHSDRRPCLAIASCGNAALAAVVLAAAGGWRLRVFVPCDADPSIIARLHDLDAEVVTCPRREDGHGDPCVLGLLEELGRGALAFTCQGNLNGLVIEGGETLSYEIVSRLRSTGLAIDHLIAQVGGGALASSCAQAFAEARALGVYEHATHFHTVQTAGDHPLERAYAKVRAQLPDSPSATEVDSALALAAARRGAYMWPWEQEPKSIATGILDDETYDWLAVVHGMLATGGQPVVVSEERLFRAHELGRAAGFDVEPTGTAGLAGLIDLLAAGVVRPDERVVVLFTGVERRA
jgi:threonine synthase